MGRGHIIKKKVKSKKFKDDAKAKAKLAAAALKDGVKKVRKRNRRTVHFRRPKMLRTPRKDRRYDNEKMLLKREFDTFEVLKHPHTSEKAMKQVEDLNVLTFICKLTANKRQIKQAFYDQYKVRPRRVNTLITTKGKKKAFIKLDPEDDALELANKIGII